MAVIERDKQRVLTSAHLAEVFGTDMAKIRYNFNYNKNRYEEGKHYFIVKGEELKDFKTEFEIHTELKHAHTIYLWTEKGAFLHAKSLNTDQAWNAYSKLVDDYFKKAEEEKMASDFTNLSPQLQFMIMMEQKHNELEQKTNRLEEENSELKQSVRHLSLVVDNEIWITDHQRAEIREAVGKRVGYLKTQFIDAHFQGLYSALNTYFGVPKYDKIKRVDFEQAMQFIAGWFPKKKEETVSL
jgi:hypothetical protein